jgi:predicted acyltransferase
LLGGHLLLSKRTPQEKVILLMVFGFVSVTIGYVWGLSFPVNKNLWSSSFVLVTSGLASLLLGTLYYIVDIRHHTSGTKPGIIFGANAIAIYFISDVISIIFYSLKFGAASLNEHFMKTFTGAGLDPKLVSMLYAIVFVCINFCIAYVLYRKKIFIKL